MWGHFLMHFPQLQLFTARGLPELQEQSLCYWSLMDFFSPTGLSVSFVKPWKKSDLQHPVLTSWAVCVCCEVSKGCCGCGPASCWPLSFMHQESWWAVGPFSLSPCRSSSETPAPLCLFQVEEVVSLPAFHAQRLVHPPGGSRCCSLSRLQLHCIPAKMGRQAR